MKLTVSKKKYIFILAVIIFIIASFIRLLYWRHAPGVIVSEDTYSYYLAGQRMIKEGLFVHYFRPPVYSLLLNLVMYVTGAADAPILSSVFFQRMIYVIIFQFGTGVISLVILFFTLQKVSLQAKPRTVPLSGTGTGVKLGPTWSFLFVLFIAGNIILFSFDRLLLTESLATSLIIILLFLCVEILMKPKPFLFVLFFLLCLILLMLRPIFIALPFLLSVIFVLYYRKKWVTFLCLTLLVTYGLFVVFYNFLNMKRYGLYDISTATNIVMLGKILDFELPIEAAKDETFFYQAVADYRQKKLEKNPFRFMEHVDILSEEKLPLIIKLKDFDRKVILPNLSTYLWRSVCQIPGALLDTSEKIILLPPKTSLTADFFRGLFLFYKYLQYLFFLTAIFAPLSFYQFLQKPNFQSAFLSILATISLYQIVFSVFFGYAEFGRLISPAQPVMYLFSFYWLGKMGKLIKASIRA